MKQHIYADNAATTKLDKSALESMMPWLTEEYGNASQPYAFARGPRKALAEARQIIATAINATPEEIYFTSGGTESDNWAIKGSALLNTAKRTIITSSIEHHAVLHACATIEQMGYPVVYLPPCSDGLITEEALEKGITNDTQLVSVMLTNNEVGTIEPVKELAERSHKYGALFHTDAVQAIGHIPVDVQELGVDMLSASAHKFNGPKGVGFLFVRKGTDIKQLIDGGAQEQGGRAGTENIAGIVGMASALKANVANMEENARHIAALERVLIQGISNLDYIRNGAIKHVPGNISLSFKNADGEAILHRMDLKGISISTGSACDSTNTQVSHVIRAIGVSEEYATGTIRITLGKDNTEEEVRIIIAALTQILGRY